MKNELFQERGQALILIALALIGLVAVMSLAVDGSAALSDRRHAQNAADTAALAAALSKVNGGNQTAWKAAATQRVTDNGYTSYIMAADQNSTDCYQLPTSADTKVCVNNPPISGVYSACNNVRFSCNDYVQVIMTTTVNTYFAHLIGFDQLHNRVEATAAAITESTPSSLNSNGIIGLSPSGCGVVTGGNGTLNVTGGGIFSNSTSSCAFRCNGNTLTANIPSVTTVGGDDLNGCTISTSYTVGAQQIAFPPLYTAPSEPTECSQSLTTSAYNWDNNSKTETLQPGHYTALPLHASAKPIILYPGVYCIDTSFSLGSTGSLSIATGNTAGVLLYFKPSTTTNVISINGGATVNIWGINSNNASSLSQYIGFLIYAAPNYSNSSAQSCSFGGGSSSTYSGTIYTPYCDLSISGNSGLSVQSQLIGYTVNLSGNPGANLDYTGAPHTTWTIPRQVGLSK